MTKVRVVANKVRNREDEEYITSRIKDDLLGFVHYNQEVIDADRQGKSPFDFSDTAIREIQVIKDKIDLEYLEKNK